MSYTRKQIKEAFIQWNNAYKLNKSEFVEEQDLQDVNKYSEEQTETLISFID